MQQVIRLAGVKARVRDQLSELPRSDRRVVLADLLHEVLTTEELEELMGRDDGGEV